MRVGVDILSERFEVLVLDDARERDVGGSVVDDGIALIVGGVKRLGVKAHRAVVEVTVTVAEILVDAAGEDDFVGDGFPMCAVGEEVCVGKHIAAF